MNTKVFNLKPERLQNLVTTSSDRMAEGDVITVMLSEYDKETETFLCFISPDSAKVFIREENMFCNGNASDFDRERISTAMNCGKHVYVNATIKQINEDGSIELDRREVIQETTYVLTQCIGSVVTATIERITQHGAYLDIGNGVTTYMGVSDFSDAKYENLDLFEEGDTVLVKIMGYDSDGCTFLVSRRGAYNRTIPAFGSVEVVTLLKKKAEGYAVAEIDPKTVGIVKTTAEYHFKSGTLAYCKIIGNTVSGFEAEFVSEI